MNFVQAGMDGLMVAAVIFGLSCFLAWVCTTQGDGPPTIREGHQGEQNKTTD